MLKLNATLHLFCMKPSLFWASITWSKTLKGLTTISLSSKSFLNSLKYGVILSTSLFDTTHTKRILDLGKSIFFTFSIHSSMNVSLVNIEPNVQSIIFCIHLPLMITFTDVGGTFLRLIQQFIFPTKNISERPVQQGITSVNIPVIKDKNYIFPSRALLAPPAYLALIIDYFIVYFLEIFFMPINIFFIRVSYVLIYAYITFPL